MIRIRFDLYYLTFSDRLILSFSFAFAFPLFVYVRICSILLVPPRNLSPPPSFAHASSDFSSHIFNSIIFVDQLKGDTRDTNKMVAKGMRNLEEC